MFSCFIVFDKEKKYPSFSWKNFIFFGEYLLNREKILSTTGERCSTTGKAGRKGVLGNFK